MAARVTWVSEAREVNHSARVSSIEVVEKLRPLYRSRGEFGRSVDCAGQVASQGGEMRKRARADKTSTSVMRWISGGHK